LRGLFTEQAIKQVYLLALTSHFIKEMTSLRFEKVCFFLPFLSVKAIEFLFMEIESTGKLTVISCPSTLYDIGHTPFLLEATLAF
jgi:hypothetical protein